MKPIADRVLIKQDDPFEKKGNILLPDQSRQEKPRGIVVSVGPKVKDVKPGDYVLFNVNWKQTFKDDGQEYVIINEPDILAILHADNVEMQKVS